MAAVVMFRNFIVGSVLLGYYVAVLQCEISLRFHFDRYVIDLTLKWTTL